MKLFTIINYMSFIKKKVNRLTIDFKHINLVTVLTSIEQPCTLVKRFPRLADVSLCKLFSNNNSNNINFILDVV